VEYYENIYAKTSDLIRFVRCFCVFCDVLIRNMRFLQNFEQFFDEFEYFKVFFQEFKLKRIQELRWGQVYREIHKLIEIGSSILHNSVSNDSSQRKSFNGFFSNEFDIYEHIRKGTVPFGPKRQKSL
jgi:hypothetical protein